jgi:hypothetical protein
MLVGAADSIAVVAAVECQFFFIDRNAEPGPLRHDELKVTLNRPSGGNVILEQQRPE